MLTKSRLTLLTLALLTASVTAQSPAPQPLLITAQTEPARRVEVPVPIRGVLTHIYLQEGQGVSENTPIAQLDDELQKRAVDLARTKADSTVEIRASENQIAFEKNELEKLRAAGASASPAEVRQHELSVTQAQLALELRRQESALARIDLAREQATLDRLTIKSPLAGTVLRIAKQPGELTDSDKPLAVIVQTTKLIARFLPARQLFGRVHTNDKITVELDTQPPITRTATIIAVDPILDSVSQLFQVKVEIDNADAAIPAGVQATWRWQP